MRLYLKCAARTTVSSSVPNICKCRDSESCLDQRLELITTIRRVTRIPVLALFFVAIVDFGLDSARFDLVVMTAALTIFILGGLLSP